MTKKTIPKNVKQEVSGIIDQFNREILGGSQSFYVARWKGAFLYLDRNDYGREGPICRLRYTGKTGDWEFAIFKYSTDRYDPEECFFPGADHIDGTIEGALRAGMEAYPA